MSDKNKHFRFELYRKLVKMWTKFLDMVTKRQIEMTTVYSLFSLFIQFSAIEIRWVSSHAKLMISWLQWLEKRWCARVRWWAIAIFQLTELNIKQIRHVFNVHVHERVLNDAINYAQKGCAMQMWGITLIRFQSGNTVSNISSVAWRGSKSVKRSARS